MNPERQTAPDHRDPKATAGLTARRRALGQPVGREGMPGPHYFDATGTTELQVGDTVTDGDGTAVIVSFRDEGDEEGGCPQIVTASELDGEDVTITLDTRPKNYLAEGPDRPENWVCDEVVVEAPKGNRHG